MKRGKFRFPPLPSIIKASGVVWVASILVFVALIFLSSDQEVFNNFTAYSLIADMFLGMAAFGIFVLTITVNIIKKKKGFGFKKSPKGFLVFGLKTFLLLALLPLFLLYRVIGFGRFVKRVKKSGFKVSLLKPKNAKLFLTRLAIFATISLTLLPIWIVGYVFVGTIAAEQLGYVSEPIPIAGTGSMYPTFPKGQTKTPREQGEETVATPGMLNYPNGLLIFGTRIFGHELGRGDIVVIENEKIRELTQELSGEPSGWVKRIVALPGDTIELREGAFYLNGEPQKEPYTARARSTFGQSFLKECNVVTVPDNHIFVMGDNRKGSGDSREMGFIEISAVSYVLPFNKQKGVLDENWRDPSRDLDEASKIKLDKMKYLELLNEKRKEAGVRQLTYQTKLEQSSLKRGEVMLKYDDFSFEATRSGYTMEKAMGDSGYSNIVWGEAPTQGFFNAEELIEYQFEFPESKKFFEDKTYQEVGIAEIEGLLNGCPTQVIVQHFAGYIPPNYKAEDIESWRRTVDNLNSIIPSWEASRGKGWIDENELSKLLDLFYRERSIASNILSKMEKNQWLSKNDEASIVEYNQLSEESIQLANKLNER